MCPLNSTENISELNFGLDNAPGYRDGCKNSTVHKLEVRIINKICGMNNHTETRPIFTADKKCGHISLCHSLQEKLQGTGK